jgi:hypothetical protein
MHAQGNFNYRKGGERRFMGPPNCLGVPFQCLNKVTKFREICYNVPPLQTTLLPSITIGGMYEPVAVETTLRTGI